MSETEACPGAAVRVLVAGEPDAAYDSAAAVVGLADRVPAEQRLATAARLIAVMLSPTQRQSLKTTVLPDLYRRTPKADVPITELPG